MQLLTISRIANSTHSYQLVTGILLLLVPVVPELNAVVVGVPGQVIFSSPLWSLDHHSFINVVVIKILDGSSKNLLKFLLIVVAY